VTVGQALREESPLGEPALGGQEARGLEVGKAAPAFEDLLAVDGRRYGMSTFRDIPVLVIVFTSNRCPTVKAYQERLRSLQADYGPRGVQLLAINSNNAHLYPEESYDRMVEFARESEYNFPYLLDEGQRVGRAYGARRTFHAFVLDEARVQRYEGRFDDSRIPERVTSADLRNALDDMLARRPVRVASTRPFGCSLDYVA
jgi:peroxiredoxin